MSDLKKYKKSIVVESKKKHSSNNVNNNIEEEELDNYSLKHQIKKLDKDTFKNIPKKEKPRNNSTILPNIFIFPSNKDYIINNDKLNTDIYNKILHGNLRGSNLIPKAKRYSKPLNTIKEKDNIVYNILKRAQRNEKRKNSVNLVIDESKYNYSKKTKSNILKRIGNHTSKSLHKVMKRSHKNLNTDIIDKIDGNKLMTKIDDYKQKDSNKIKIISSKHENNKEDINYSLKEKIEKDKAKIDVNIINTQNVCNIVYKDHSKKKKYKRFPFCCLTVDGDNSDND